MSKILTVEEFLKAEYFDLSNENQTLKAKIAMKKAIAAHVQAALEAVKDRGENCFGELVYRKKESILSAYPLTNIK